MIRSAFALISLCLVANSARAQEPALPELLARAQARDAQTDYGAAVAAYEEYARRCFALRTAALEQPCAEVAIALERAFTLAVALGDADTSERVAHAYSDHLLYAQPRVTMRIGYELARMHIQAGRHRDADAALDRWIHLHPDPPVGHAILVDALRARSALLSGREQRAAALFRRVERRYASERDELGPDASVSMELVQDAVAEARLMRAQTYVRRFLATGLPADLSTHDANRWWLQVLTPWRVRVERRLLLARLELERVYELGSPRHSVIAAALIGELYAHYAALHSTMTLPNDELIVAFVRRGEQAPGYDEARAHFEICVSWSHHHGVAGRWARRCEERLHALDPVAYPLAAELHGHASYRPLSPASPAVPQ